MPKEIKSPQEIRQEIIELFDKLVTDLSKDDYREVMEEVASDMEMRLESLTAEEGPE